MTIADAIRAATQQLEPVTDTARLDAELLMAHALGATRSDVLLRHMQDAAPGTFAALVERRMQHEPVAYIIGVQEFYGLQFAVGPGVLIPRADSETTLLAALDAAPANARVLDCGTGPGTLLLAFLAERPEAAGLGIDASHTALEFAARNAQSLGLTHAAQFLQADWTQAGWADPLGQFDLILANPPYVETGARLAPDVANWEPPEALFAGRDGLDDYRILIPHLRALLRENGVAVLEIGAAQAGAVEQIASESGFATTLHRDLAHRSRALVLR